MWEVWSEWSNNNTQETSKHVSSQDWWRYPLSWSGTISPLCVSKSSEPEHMSAIHEDEITQTFRPVLIKTTRIKKLPRTL